MVKSGWPDSKPRKRQAEFDSVCPECGDEILAGDEIHYSEYHDAWVCHPCRGS